ncbi:hypothetical protein CLAFUW4_09317 [Fulvia fulva]|uniref:Carboxymuconolactone decarboxylase-like domain-containing protein n=1 Tax=Passalora fulva TaxID=5499 RepID=A0A9Q8PGB8_PASFU|nr:uncharacterized protein CLAFUR5_09417 [Fulvia fulva]KAK4613526.1 hypothetical protein CLAFUR4_09323 [Fulvia fulva]KAK4614815.1 hypothetical protein CLAFUR0_09315 [Fulvia fulva]UJO21905.1 hypothetical protein CLAFUR5_09417 [Fulvia fulva]WPV20373.1 hypothetical protein CLAFUW4_09317 [Fulvia fulva]WPV35436.1 hypothetical protein CLAFUW7_09318 [Fulvia fulva]
MALEELLAEFRDKEQTTDITKANWYNIAAAALAAASAGHEVVKLCRFATKDVDLETQKLVQRRIKETILKTSWLYGGPKAILSLFPLFKDLKEEETDHFGARWEAHLRNDPNETAEAEARGKLFFDKLWSPEAAKENLDFNFKHSPHLYLLVKHNLYFYASEPSILSFIETELIYAAALTCSNVPQQAEWHTRGIVRQGGTKEQARQVQELSLKMAEMYDCRTGKITPVDEIEWDDKKSHA